MSPIQLTLMYLVNLSTKGGRGLKNPVKVVYELTQTRSIFLRQNKKKNFVKVQSSHFED